MKVKFTTRALADADALDAWWKQNRPSAPLLFESELADALDQLSRSPTLGAEYALSGLDAPIRRWLLPRTKNHVYYVVEGDELIVLAVWGGTKGRGPRL